MFIALSDMTTLKAYAYTVTTPLLDGQILSTENWYETE